jgi:TP901 family phage tail tape measure protein
MGTRTTDVRVRVGADIAGFDLAMKSAENSAKVFERELAKLEAQQRQMATWEAQAYREETTRNAKRAESIGQVGKGFMAAGAVIGIGLGLATKAAMDWQTSMAGVEKVVTGSLSGMSEAAKTATLGALDSQLRDLSKTIPATAEDIASVAQSAAQLGVSVPDLAKFTATAEALGATTSMSAEDAATGLAKLGNVMGVLPKDVDRAGSALLALGNYGASTEQEILDMSTRIAGAGKVVGLTEAEVLGFANALTSVGINAEEGGSAISRVFIDMATAAQNGGEKLTGFATVAGMTAAEFKTKFGQDAAGAMTTFLAGLHKVQASGGDVFGTLNALGLSEIRVRDTLLRASAASDLMASSLQLGTQAWKDNNALLEAAAVKYDTSASKVAIARNNINDAAITIGQTFLPIVGSAAERVATLAKMFEDLPGPAKSALSVIGALGAGTLILGGSAMSLVPKVRSLLTTLDEMGGVGAKAATGLRATGSALAGPWGIALAAGTIALGYWIDKQAEAKQRADELKQTLDAQTGAVTQDSRAWVANQLVQDGITENARKLGIDLSTLTDAALGNAQAMAQVNAVLDEYSRLSDNNARQAPIHGVAMANAASVVRDAIGGQNDALNQAKQNWQDTHDAMGAAATQADSTSGSVSGLTGTVGSNAQAFQDATKQLDDFSKALKALYDEELGVEGAQDAFKSSLIDITDTATKSATATTKATAADREAAKVAGDKAKAAALAAGETSKQATAAGKAAHDQYLANVTHKQTAEDAAKAQLDLREKMRSAVQRGYDLIDEMAKQGASSKDLTDKAKELGDQIYEAGRKAGLSKAEAEHYRDALLQIPGQVSTSFTANGLAAVVEQVQTLLNHIALVNGKKVTLQVDASSANVREGRGPTGITQPSAATPTANLPQKLAKASGGIVAYAWGGEDHVAQIARPGDMRVWAEPETGGEAYIPLAPGKRGRSMAVLADVAHRFGAQVSYGSGPPRVVTVPVQSRHEVHAPINVEKVVTQDAGSFTDWAAGRRSFGAEGAA